MYGFEACFADFAVEMKTSTVLGIMKFEVTERFPGSFHKADLDKGSLICGPTVYFTSNYSAKLSVRCIRSSTGMISLKLRIAANFPIKCNFSVRVGTQLLYHINKLFNNDCREYGFDNIGMEDDLFQDDVFETKWCVCLMPELDVVVKKAYRPPTLQLLDDEEFSDVILECKNGQVRAHKMILAAASPVFKGMFLSRENGNVVIDSFDVEVVKRAKLLMYTKEVEDDDEVFYMDPNLALPLYAFAQFFELNDRDLVLQWFKENIGFDNVVYVANYCHLRHFYFSEIYQLCLKFIANNHANISKIEKLPDIHDEILKAALCSVKPRKSVL